PQVNYQHRQQHGARQQPEQQRIDKQLRQKQSRQHRQSGGQRPERDEAQQARGGMHHWRGAATWLSSLSSNISLVWPSISASALSWMRWRNTGRATALTSSGMTKSRPSSSALARAAMLMAMLARGPAPRARPGNSRVVRTSRSA